jgi:L-threonylcarbamoyladenylate synthase
MSVNNMINTPNIDEAIIALKQGEIIAYPTEAVFGLGCDPFNESSVMQLLQLKHRPVDKGLILIAHDWQQVAKLIAPIDDSRLKQVLSTWPGPVTWVFPAAATAPAWIRGDHPGIALRITAHPIASALCQAFGGPIVSTSANLDGEAPAKDTATVQDYFGSGIALIADGPLGENLSPTPIFDAVTGAIIRR